MDLFGDGWNDAALHVIDPRGEHTTYEPTPETDYQTHVKYCVDPEDMKKKNAAITVDVRDDSKQAWEVKFVQ